MNFKTIWKYKKIVAQNSWKYQRFGKNFKISKLTAFLIQH